MPLNDITNNTSSNVTVKRKRLTDYELGTAIGHYDSGLMPAAIGSLVSPKPDQKHLVNVRGQVELTAALKEEWSLLDADYLETLFSSMGRRRQAVIEAEGSIAKY
ncbi:hypothetical protein MFLAVUS_008419 [Mucor flavus]|uniref:Uncharacterized protein n=1 Tax=Mucor flavus TaxID=439312 RepID=A0ABP9Z713_9FUNG